MEIATVPTRKLAEASEIQIFKPYIQTTYVWILSPTSSNYFGQETKIFCVSVSLSETDQEVSFDFPAALLGGSGLQSLTEVSGNVSLLHMVVFWGPQWSVKCRLILVSWRHIHHILQVYITEVFLSGKMSKLPGWDDCRNSLSGRHGYYSNSRLKQENHTFQSRLCCTVRLSRLINLLILKTEKSFFKWLFHLYMEWKNSSIMPLCVVLEF